MRRSIVVWFALSLLAPGCGLALDYDPPEDGGAGMDGAIDAGGCGVACEDGTVCIGGSCLHPCTNTSECHFDDAVCEVCDVSVGACVPSDATCDAGCDAVCDPVEDRCRASCSMGQSCVGGACTTGVACTTVAECPVSDDGCGFECLEGLCQALPEFLCPDDDYECAFVDSCTGCAPIVVAENCSEGTLCDIDGGTFRCLECSDALACADGATPICDAGTCRPCTGDGECVAAGLGSACVDNACVPCAVDEDCGGTRVCDRNTNQCVGCLNSTTCPSGQVCRLGTHTCGPCVGAEDCGGASCEMGVCRRECSLDSDCIETCRGRPTCTAGECRYGTTTVTTCEDGIACTDDSCVPEDVRANAFGCLHVPQDVDCSDDAACTTDSCVVDPMLPGGGGCVHTPRNTICRAGMTGTTPRCIESICLPGAMGHDTQGCVPSYVGPCALGEACRMDGTCEAVTRCDACRDDGFACNGVETCAAGLCTQVFTSSASSCTGDCDQYCSSNTGCTSLPGAPHVTCRAAID